MQISKITGITVRCHNCSTQMDFTLVLLDKQNLHQITCPGCGDRLSVDLVLQIAKAYNHALSNVQALEAYGVVEYFTND